METDYAHLWVTFYNFILVVGLVLALVLQIKWLDGFAGSGEKRANTPLTMITFHVVATICLIVGSITEFIKFMVNLSNISGG